ncbi:MAG TPA: ABC transporter permease subunit [Candidatus Coproplasma excrementigallinarum]|uniref:ABC transporter permease subunit n=1 Tax=Candidatus Coproplasma excrementigallinarum TaxID=2840747 RepID=A0A9D1MKX9_9FIRM|nr:ABC transporter permease subunit [Candidatus Coproplasma excrementigallinarum]
MKTSKKTALMNVVWGAVAVCVIFVVWLIAYACVKNDYVLPGVGQTFEQFFALFGQSSFYIALGNTLLRTVISFVISFALAALFAAVSAVCRPFYVVFSCLVSVVRTLPTMAVTLMLLIWSTPLVAPAIVTALVLFPMLYSQLVAAIDGVDFKLLEMAKVYGLSRRTKLTKIILPSILPETLAQVGAGLSLGLKIMISAEVLSYTFNSIGGMMQQAQLYAEMPRFAALTLMCIALGLLFELLSFGIRCALRRLWGGRQ